MVPSHHTCCVLLLYSSSIKVCSSVLDMQIVTVMQLLCKLVYGVIWRHISYLP